MPVFSITESPDTETCIGTFTPDGKTIIHPVVSAVAVSTYFVGVVSVPDTGTVSPTMSGGYNGPFWGLSPIHLLVPLTLFGIVGALRGVYTHNFAMHRRAMLSVYIGGMLIAGTLTFLPGRIMHAVAFGS